jgi:hypothetical protein
VNAGYTFNALNSTTTSTNAFAFAGAGPLASAITNLANSTVPITNDGFVGGAQLGYDWQVPGPLVWDRFGGRRRD